ncbi:hypothetical protein QAD02_010261 [Eretmocerus hayati]|uniref:Uncharacterized protein n=1 Tax=Eretmocerus hayati TaxID=131215 RepID=A0ACC2NCT8_9HYME|nr:hypothetical protein QAD02_010261 [Eretmocerus hayati]
MEEIERESIIVWCCQKQYYGDMLLCARQAVEAYSSNERLRIFLALSFALNQQSKEALKQATSLSSPDENADAALAALLIRSYVLKNQGTADRMLVADIDAKIREDRKKASPLALSLAAMVLLLLKKVDKAKEYADRAYKLDPSDSFVVLAQGWCSLDAGDSTKDPGTFFEAVLKENNKHFNALLGSAKSREMRQDHAGAMLILNPLIVRYPKLSIPLVEKMHNLLALRDWDQVIETSNRILSFESANIDAFLLKAIVVICKEGDYVEGAKHVQTFFRNLLAAEPKNIELFVENVQLFSRICVKNQTVLAELFKLTDKTMQQNPGKACLALALGELCSCMGKPKDAEHWHRCALRLDESLYGSLLGLARCQITKDDGSSTSSAADDLARQQIDFLASLRAKGDPEPELGLLRAAIAPNPQEALASLHEASVALLKSCSGLCYGCEYLRILNPDLSMDIVSTYLTRMPCNDTVNTSDTKSATSSDRDDQTSNSVCIKLIERVCEACPGLSSGLLLMGKVKMHLGDLKGASVALKVLLDSVDRTNAEGHLLMARILARQGYYESASRTLEVGLSYNFKVRDDPLYHMIVGIVAKQNDDLEGAVKSFEIAMSLSGITSPNSTTITTPKNSNNGTLSNSDRATLCLEMISALAKLRRFPEAQALIEETLTRVKGGPEEGRAVIGHAELCLEMDQISKAIELLESIKPNEPYFLRARTALAQLHLHRRGDRRAFAKCYRELVENCPSAETYGMLGDAYLAIEEPERAIEAYELSLDSSPGDKQLVRKMGRALARTHQYAKAIGYYREALKLSDCPNLKLDMAELFMKLKQYDKAEEALLDDLNEGRGVNDVSALEMRGKQLLLLAKVREMSGNLKGALTTLSEAKENQSRYVQRATMLPSLTDQKNVLADICFSMAEHASSLRNFEQAVDHYKETLAHKPNDIRALLSLAKLYMQMNELEKCTQYCQILLNADPNNEAACVMMADLAFRKVDFDTAAFHFRQLLLQKPTYWTALARLIEVSRRTGNIDDLGEWLLRAEAAMDTARPIEAGFYYCSGLLGWRTGRVNAALRSFNAARRDPEWGQQAIYNMIEICLDPDDESALSSELFSDDYDSDNPKSAALKTAQKLLQELNPKGSPHEMLTHRLLGNFYLLATKQKHNIERALNDCTALASQESLRDHVGPALGLATAHILLKQTPRARNHLKRVSKNTWTFEDAEYLERCWLLLAEIHVQSGKFELAGELLRRVVQHNATCVRAHELWGLVAEKEQAWREAASRYGLAWRYGGKLKLNIGYKLAYSCHKARKHAEAIEACLEVLRANPDYPRIRRDIMDKSVALIRT